MIRLEQTCGACPEQYNAYIGDICVGYLRLRHGHFSVECNDETVYTASPKGDGLFECDEREFYLTKAKAAILNHLNDKQSRLEQAQNELSRAEENFGN